MPRVWSHQSRQAKQLLCKEKWTLELHALRSICWTEFRVHSNFSTMPFQNKFHSTFVSISKWESAFLTPTWFAVYSSRNVNSAISKIYRTATGAMKNATWMWVAKNANKIDKTELSKNIKFDCELAWIDI